MADELQALLDRITADGLKKAEEERRAVLERAAGEAQRLLTEAKTQAAAITAAAQREATLLSEKGEQALQQAARDVLLSLRAELEKRVVEVARLATARALDAQAMAALVAELVRRFAESGGREARVEVLLSATQAEALGQALATALGSDLRARVQLRPMPTLKAGFQIRATGTDVAYDFSDEALAEAMAAFLSPRLAAIVAGGER